MGFGYIKYKNIVASIAGDLPKLFNPLTFQKYRAEGIIKITKEIYLPKQNIYLKYLVSS